MIRDHHGVVKLAGHGTTRGGASPEAAEAVAVRHGLEIARAKGFQKIILASDCQSIILKIQATVVDRSMVGTVVGDIRKLASGFLSCSFMYVSRLCNVAAHKLARSKEPSVCKLYTDEIPDFVRDEPVFDVL